MFNVFIIIFDIISSSLTDRGSIAVIGPGIIALITAHAWLVSTHLIQKLSGL